MTKPPCRAASAPLTPSRLSARPCRCLGVVRRLVAREAAAVSRDFSPISWCPPRGCVTRIAVSEGRGTASWPDRRPRDAGSSADRSPPAAQSRRVIRSSLRRRAERRARLIRSTARYVADSTGSRRDQSPGPRRRHVTIASFESLAGWLFASRTDREPPSDVTAASSGSSQYGQGRRPYFCSSARSRVDRLLRCDVVGALVPLTGHWSSVSGRARRFLGEPRRRSLSTR